MIRSLRQRHRRLAVALGIFLPVAFAVGIAARKPVPAVAELPAALVATPQKFEAVVWERADLFAKTPVRVRLVREQTGAGRFAIALAAAKDFARPDLIVCWTAGNPNLTDALPDKAILLGPFGSGALPLPDETATSNGALVLYSLANGEIVDVSKPIRFNDSTQ